MRRAVREFVDARVIDLDGVYNPCRPNDRLLLGMKGSISEFELGVLRSRMLDAARSKARRGELRDFRKYWIGFVWHREIGLGLDPDCRVQEVTGGIFQRFRELGSARQVHLALKAEQVHFPRPGERMTTFDWTPIRYRNAHLGAEEPVLCRRLRRGKSVNRTQIVDGRSARKTYGHYRPLRDCEILLQDHHEGYIDWEEFERNQKQLDRQRTAARMKAAVQPRRPRPPLLAGLLVCHRCTVGWRRPSTPDVTARPSIAATEAHRCTACPGVWRSAGFASMQRSPAKLIRAVEPMAIEAAQLAERRKMSSAKPNITAFLSSNSSRRAMRRLSPNAATPPATPTTG